MKTCSTFLWIKQLSGYCPHRIVLTNENLNLLLLKISNDLNSLILFDRCIIHAFDLLIDHFSYLYYCFLLLINIPIKTGSNNQW